MRSLARGSAEAPETLFHREGLRAKAGRTSRFEKGSLRDVQQLINSAREATFDYRVSIVQPGLSKGRMSPEHHDVLGATESFLMETYSMPLRVIASL